MIALLLAAALPLFDDASLARLRQGETLSDAQIDGNSGSARAWTLARCPPSQVWRVITDHASFAEFMPHLKSV
ncbi:MAG: SRPBCC family protein, partial [Myxococcales bacterium]